MAQASLTPQPTPTKVLEGRRYNRLDFVALADRNSREQEFMEEIWLVCR